MGAAASRSAAKTATAKTATAAAAKKQTQTLEAALRSESSRDAVVVSHLDTSMRDLNGASLLRNPNAPPPAAATALEEMNAALLEDARRFQDYDSVGFLQVRDWDMRERRG